MVLQTKEWQCIKAEVGTVVSLEDVMEASVPGALLAREPAT